MTSFYQFARPAILKFLGARELLLPRLKAGLSCPVKGSTDRPHYMSGILTRDGEGFSVSPAGPQGSGILSTLSRANCYMIIPPEGKPLEKGRLVECEIFNPAW